MKKDRDSNYIPITKNGRGIKIMISVIPVVKKVSNIIYDELEFIKVSDIRFVSTYTPKKSKVVYIVLNTDSGEYIFPYKFEHIKQLFGVIPNFEIADRSIIANLEQIVEIDSKKRVMYFTDSESDQDRIQVSIAESRVAKIKSLWAIIKYKLKGIAN
jgi:DNA-binding LytR/AlgR family response regulator